MVLVTLRSGWPRRDNWRERKKLEAKRDTRVTIEEKITSFDCERKDMDTEVDQAMLKSADAFD
jgi:hypothetical protein